MYVAIINAAQILNIQGFDLTNKLEYRINLASYTFIVLLTGFFAGLCWMAQFYLTQKEKIKAYKRELEKSSVSNSSNSSKVEVLEAKIATLEKALDDALKK